MASLLVGPANLFALPTPLAETIFTQIRLPRTLLGLLTGATLAMSGAALQGLLRNPLASPDILGTSAGAALGAVSTGYLLALGGTVWMSFGGMAGAIIALTLLLALAGRGASTTTLILAGVAISALAGAAMNLALALSPSPFALYDIIFWLLGSLADRSTQDLLFGSIPMILGCALLLTTGPSLDRLALGEDVAETLGVDVRRLRLKIIIASGIAVGGAVSVTGAIGFVGLVVPHLVRPLLDERPGAALLPSAVAGAALLTIADLATRMPVAGRTLPIGVLTALIGAPFFLWLILKARRI
ncbi:MAG: iron ABC transporter permease [Pacificimonas sp.]